MEWVHNLLRQFSELDEGVRNATYGALGGIFVWLLERFRRKPDRVKVAVDAPKGQLVNIHVGGEVRGS